MKMKLRIEKRGKPLLDRIYDITDAESFGNACADAFNKLHADGMARATSVGEVFEEINSYALGELQGATIRLSRV